MLLLHQLPSQYLIAVIILLLNIFNTTSSTLFWVKLIVTPKTGYSLHIIIAIVDRTVHLFQEKSKFFCFWLTKQPHVACTDSSCILVAITNKCFIPWILMTISLVRVPSITVTRALQAVVHLLAQTRDNLQYYNIYG